MRLPAILLPLALLAASATAQSPDMAPQGYTLALAAHPGRLRLSAPSYDIAEYSAKPSGSEYGIRGREKASSTELLAFLFLYPEMAPVTAEKCRDGVMQAQKGLQIDTQTMLPGGIAMVHYTAKNAKGTFSAVRAFAAKGDLCADIEFSGFHPVTADDPAIRAALASIQFEPDFQPTFREVFAYATILFAHHAVQPAALFYEKSLTLLPAGTPSEKWRRVATDQAIMSFGMAGNVDKSRALANQAITLDPAYPLNYYNLACADAEQGDAKNARLHLQQAFDRKANALPGEGMPNPAEDDSFLKLKDNKEFWTFVQSLPKSK